MIDADGTPLLLSQDISAWLEHRGVDDVAWTYDAQGFNRVDNASRAAMISFTGGPGLQDEGSIDVLSFQVRCRGPQRDDMGAARMFAHRIDTLITTATSHGPVVIGGVKVQQTDRVGAAPAQFGPRDAAFRVQTTCNYLFYCVTGR